MLTLVNRDGPEGMLNVEAGRTSSSTRRKLWIHDRNREERIDFGRGESRIGFIGMEWSIWIWEIGRLVSVYVMRIWHIMSWIEMEMKCHVLMDYGEM